MTEISLALLNVIWMGNLNPPVDILGILDIPCLKCGAKEQESCTSGEFCTIRLMSLLGLKQAFKLD